MKSWLHDNDIKMNSTQWEGKFLVLLKDLVEP